MTLARSAATLAALALLALLALAALLAASAQAAPRTVAEAGVGAGRVSNPYGVAVDQSDGRSVPSAGTARPMGSTTDAEVAGDPHGLKPKQTTRRSGPFAKPGKVR